MKTKKSMRLYIEYYFPTLIALFTSLTYVILAFKGKLLLTMNMMLYFSDKLFNMSNVLFGFILALIGIFFSIKTSRLVRDLKAEGYYVILKAYVGKACLTCGLLSLFCLSLNAYGQPEFVRYIHIAPTKYLLIIVGAVFVYLLVVVLACVYRLVAILCKTM